VTVVYKITNPSDRAHARRQKRPRHTLHRAATEQEERYVTPPFRDAQPRGVSHRIAEQTPDTPAEPVPDINTRAV